MDASFFMLPMCVHLNYYQSYHRHFNKIYYALLRFLQITDLPFSLYSTFVIEARHGFNKVHILSSNSIIYVIFY